MEQILLTIAILTTGIIYGTDVFFAVVGKKASRMSKDSSIADLLGHIISNRLSKPCCNLFKIYQRGINSPLIVPQIAIAAS